MNISLYLVLLIVALVLDFVHLQAAVAVLCIALILHAIGAV